MTSILKDEKSRSETDRPFYTLYVGSPTASEFSASDRKKVLDIVIKRFTSFTTLDGQGFFEGKPLPTMIIQIATKDRFSMSVLCQELCDALGQRWIGLSDGDLYRSVRRHVEKPSNGMSVSDMHIR